MPKADNMLAVPLGRGGVLAAGWLEPCGFAIRSRRRLRQPSGTWTRTGWSITAGSGTWSVRPASRLPPGGHLRPVLGRPAGGDRPVHGGPPDGQPGGAAAAGGALVPEPVPACPHRWGVAPANGSRRAAAAPELPPPPAVRCDRPGARWAAAAAGCGCPSDGTALSEEPTLIQGRPNSIRIRELTARIPFAD